MQFKNIVTGKVFGLKEWEKKSGDGKYYTFTFSYGVKNDQGQWNNTYLNITHFGDEVENGEVVQLSGKFEPNSYVKKDGTIVETLKFTSFEVIDSDRKEKREVINFDEISDDDLEINPFQ